MLAPDAQLTITAPGHYLLHPAEQLPELAPAAEARFGWVAYHGDFEDAYRRVDGDESGFLVPEQLIEARETAQRILDAANQAIRRYIDDNDVAEVDLDDLGAAEQPGHPAPGV
ncbi:hypothetical protein [Actinoplanes subglobosus]|uniref:Uncharacterized protein n=1 Tax=Actinoplanes subglobosus TaxID=1547892 RepID=A0ABV8IV64_9ACTN